jgi:hypothetical protein
VSPVKIGRSFPYVVEVAAPPIEMLKGARMRDAQDSREAQFTEIVRRIKRPENTKRCADPGG